MGELSKNHDFKNHKNIGNAGIPAGYGLEDKKDKAPRKFPESFKSHVKTHCESLMFSISA
jgi:hypothetical protein